MKKTALLVLIPFILLYSQTFHIKKGWQLLGTSTDIDPHSFYGSCVKSVWSYKNGRWKIYINDDNIYDFSENIDTMELLNANDGFWINSKENCDINTTLLTLKSFDKESFPKEFYPKKSHPRLWLTEERIKNLKNNMDNDTNEWENFKNLCDSIIDSDTSNDPYGLDISPQNFTAPLALMYILTKDNRYADKALELMDRVDLDFSQYGDADHESFYFLGLTYDWLYNYSGMTEEKREKYHKIMRDLSDKFWNEYNINASGTDSDNDLLTGMMHLIFGGALYGDFDDANLMFDRGWFGWSRGYYQNSGISNSDIIASALGGVYFTGMAYFPSTDIIGIAGYELTLKTAFGYDVNIIQNKLKPFWKNCIYSIIYLTDPLKKSIEDYGSWQDPNTLDTQPWLRRAMKILSYFSLQNGDEKAAMLAKGYSKEVDIGYENDYFLELFFDNTDLKSLSPYEEKLPLVRFAKNPDFLIFRNGWDENAAWGVFRGDGYIPLDQQAPDQGHFSLWYNGSYLTKGARNYDALLHGDFFNTLSIQNNCSYNNTPCSGTPIFDSKKAASITRYKISEQPLFAYCMLNADDQYDDNPSSYEAEDNVITYRRHFFWADRYVVIFDRVRNKTPLNVRYRLRALNEPTINGNLVSQISENKKAKLIQKTLEPKNVTIYKIDESKLWKDVPDWVVDNSQRAWQSVIDINSTTKTDILNVIKTGDTAIKDFDNLIDINDAENCGVVVDNWSVIFSCEENLRDEVTLDINDSIKNIHNLIADMKEGSYHIYSNGKYIFDKNADSNHTLFFDLNLSEYINNIKIELFESE